MKAIIYSRVSSVSDRQSNDRQIIDLKRHAKLNDIEVIKVFEEKASGAKTRRPVMTEALEFAVSEKVDIVLVSELSRLGRNIYDVLNSCNFLIEHHINLYLQKEQITLLDTDGQAVDICPNTSCRLRNVCPDGKGKYSLSSEFQKAQVHRRRRQGRKT